MLTDLYVVLLDLLGSVIILTANALKLMLILLIILLRVFLYPGSKLLAVVLFISVLARKGIWGIHQFNIDGWAEQNNGGLFCSLCILSFAFWYAAYQLFT